MRSLASHSLTQCLPESWTEGWTINRWKLATEKSFASFLMRSWQGFVSLKTYVANPTGPGAEELASWGRRRAKSSVRCGNWTNLSTPALARHGRDSRTLCRKFISRPLPVSVRACKPAETAPGLARTSVPMCDRGFDIRDRSYFSHAACGRHVCEEFSVDSKCSGFGPAAWRGRHNP